MSSMTPNLGLILDGQNDFYDIDKFNSNFEKLDNSTQKHLLDYDGGKIKENGVNLSFSDLYAMLMNKPDFVVLVYQNKAYHPNVVNTEHVVFSSTTVSNGLVRVDRITMGKTGAVTVTFGEAEKTSSKTDDVAGNATDSSKYPSTKGVADYVDGNYLPLTGGTLTGNLGLFGGYGGVGASAYMAYLLSSINQQNDDTSRKIVLSNSASGVSLANAIQLEDRNASGNTSYTIYGEHNRPNVFYSRGSLPAGTDLNYVLDTGSYAISTVNAPSILNIPNKYASHLHVFNANPDGGDRVIQFWTRTNTANTGGGDVYFRVIQKSVNAEPIASEWRQLGGGGMRVPIAYGSGALFNTNRTLNINGKGTIWINNATVQGSCTVVVDGVTLATDYKVTGAYGHTDHGYDAMPFDFTSSVQVTFTGDASSGLYGTNYAYELYK